MNAWSQQWTDHWRERLVFLVIELLLMFAVLVLASHRHMVWGFVVLTLYGFVCAVRGIFLYQLRQEAGAGKK